MRRSIGLSSVFASAALAALAAGSARGSAQEGPTFASEVDQVYVTVVVKDNAGRLVSDLTAGDFQLFENGRPQRIMLFGRATEPGQDKVLALDLGLLMDTSTSMLKELKLSQQAAVHFLDSIPRARDLVTVFFDDDIRLSRYNSENQQGLFERIFEAKGGGNTALYDAISVYLSRVQDAQGRKVLVLFTDGEDSRSALGLGETLELVRASGVVIYPIAFTNAFPQGSSRAVRARAVLSQLAEATGGEVFSPRSFRDLSDIYDKILDQIRSQYVLGFVSDTPSQDGKFRKLKVEVAGKDRRVRHREGYYPPSS